MAIKNYFLAVPPGEDTSDPTRVGKPAPVTYKKQGNHLDRGSVIWDRTNPDGSPMKDTNYGRGQSAVPSSVSVEDSAHMTDMDTHVPDPVLAGLIKQGMGDHSAAVSAPVEDLTRKIDISNPVPDAYGTESARSRQSSSHNSEATKIPASAYSSTTRGPGRP